MRLDFANDWKRRHAKYGYTPLIRICMKPRRTELARQLRVLQAVPGSARLCINEQDVRCSAYDWVYILVPPFDPHSSSCMWCHSC